MATSKRRGSSSRKPRGPSKSSKKRAPAAGKARRRTAGKAGRLAESTGLSDKNVDLNVDESPDAVEHRREAQSGPGAPGVPHTGTGAGGIAGEGPEQHAGAELDRSAVDEDYGLEPTDSIEVEDEDVEEHPHRH